MTLTEQVEKKIISEVKSGNYLHGGKLPTLKQLCLLFDASEITVRNAIKNLQHANILFVKQGSGIYIKKQPETSNTV
ncbi:MAG: GntR family transcriptional regulator, partial [Victivallaceae bacterium]|nr:GntR family transcriptional regulator [Victivallaceae bacterium]